MRITGFSDYAFRVLMYLALHEEGRATIGDIAQSYEVSQHHLTKVVQVLAHAGLVQTLRGKGGGICLAREPDTIHLGDVVWICEGDRPVLECLEPGPVRCRIAPACRLVGFVNSAFAAFYAELNRHTLADLVQAPRDQALTRILMVDS